jgi:hypothetical protein
VRVVGRKTKRGIRVEVRDSGRGHGLTIAAKAVHESGGTLKAAKAGNGTAVAIDLPLADADAPVQLHPDRPGAAEPPARLHPDRPGSAEPPGSA